MKRPRFKGDKSWVAFRKKRKEIERAEIREMKAERKKLREKRITDARIRERKIMEIMVGGT